MMSTGERSLWNRIHGGISALVEQSKEKITFEKMKRRIKDIAALENDYPHRTRTIKIKKADGTIKNVVYVEPCSMSGESTTNGMKIYITLQEIADAYRLYLYEYLPDETPYRTVGGRSYEDMKKYIAELKQNGDIEKARILSQVPKKVGRGWKWEDPEEIF